MTLTEIFTLSGIILANAGAITMVFTKLNIKIAEIATEVLALKKDMEEHKEKNRDDIKEIKDIVSRDRAENREDHNRLMAETNSINKNINEFKIDLIKIINKK